MENTKTPYTVNNGKQKYCPDCKEEMMKKVDREQSLAYYHENKEEINERRKIKKRHPGKRCVICGKDFYSPTVTKYCSEECRKEGTKSNCRLIYDKRRKK